MYPNLYLLRFYCEEKKNRQKAEEKQNKTKKQLAFTLEVDAINATKSTSISWPLFLLEGISIKYICTVWGYQNQMKLYPKVFKLMARMARVSFLPFRERTEQKWPEAELTLCGDMAGPLLCPPNLASFHLSSCYTQTHRKNEKMCVNPCPRLIKTWSMASLWFQIQFSPVRSSDSNLCCLSVPTFGYCWCLFLQPFRSGKTEWRP